MEVEWESQPVDLRKINETIDKFYAKVQLAAKFPLHHLL
jgi:hypothetical protein